MLIKKRTMFQGICEEPQGCKTQDKFLETILKYLVNEHMQPHEPLESYGEDHQCIIFPKMQKS